MRNVERHETVQSELVSFGDFELDLQSGELRRDDGIIALRPLATRCLVLLVCRAGRLVTMEEIRRELWGTTVVDWSAGIHQVVRQIRHGLGDVGHHMVETVTRHGYRFRPPVTPVQLTPPSVSTPRQIGLRGYAAGFATPFVFVSVFLIWCGSLS